MLTNVEKGLIVAILMQFVGIQLVVMFVTAKKVVTGMAMDSIAIITIRAGTGQGSMDFSTISSNMTEIIFQFEINFHRSDSSPCKEYSICRTDLTADDKTACTCLSPLTGVSDYSKL